jgi:hypothetical protein
MLNELRSEVVACFVDIGGIVDHHCFNILFIILLIQETVSYFVVSKF